MAEQSNTKRIAKNTLMLYFRQILIMLVSLYTVRVVLNVLGAEDYGIYNVIAGVVVLFNFVNNAMASGTQRFLNFYLGKKDIQKTNEVYSSSIIIHFFIALVFLVAAESLGIWFVYYKLNIPVERHSVAVIVYQFTILTTIFSILGVPYRATVIAHEKMGFFAFQSIIEAFLKLFIVFILKISTWDKLILYASLLTFVSLVITLLLKFYCNISFEIAHFKKISNLTFLKEQLSFSGWSVFGAAANVANSQGTNIVLNLFTNVTVNASMGIANQVNSAVYSFVSNFQTAFNPQIIKSYAEDDKDYFLKLIIRTSKFSFFLLSIMVVPLLINTEFVLEVWLKNIPNYSTHFVQLILIWSLIDSWNGPLWMSVQATGDIKKYQLFISVFIFLNLPLSIIALLLGATPEIVLIIRICINLFETFWRIFFLHRRIYLSRKKFFFEVLFRCCIIFLFSISSTFFFGKLFSNRMLYFFMTCIFSVITNIFLIFILGSSTEERNTVLKTIKRKLLKKYE